MGVDVEDELNVNLAYARLHLRKIDAKIAAHRRETEFCRGIGVGREDFKVRGFNGLADERAEVVEYIKKLESRSNRVPKPRKTPLAAWLLLPLLLPMLAFKAVVPRRESPRERVQRFGWQSQPRVSFDLG